MRFALALIYTVGELAVAATFVLVSLRAMRVGLLTRMMGTVGIIGGVLFLIPLTPLPVVQALWLIFFGAMLLSASAGVRCRRPGPSPRPARGRASRVSSVSSGSHARAPARPETRRRPRPRPRLHCLAAPRRMPQRSANGAADRGAGTL